LLEWDPAHPEVGAKLILTNETTWFGLGVLLKPETVIGNHPNLCGFYFLPYQTFLEYTAINPPTGHDTPAVSYIGLEWNDRSYLVCYCYCSVSDFFLSSVKEGQR